MTFDAKGRAQEFAERYDIEGNVPDSGPIVGDLTAALQRAYDAGRADGLQRAAEIARVMDTTAWACDAAVEIAREAETKGRVG